MIGRRHHPVLAVMRGRDAVLVLTVIGVLWTAILWTR